MKKTNDLFTGCIAQIERVIGYTFRDKSLITQAFTRTSWCNEANQRGEAYQSNEVLEFVGDSVLSVAIITFLMKTHAERYGRGIKTKLDEGDFSNIKSKLSDKKNLSECIGVLGLEKFLRLGEGDKKLGIENEPSVKEDLFESIIGAVYLDCDMDIPTIMGVVSRMLDVSLYAVKNPPMQSSKNALQEFCADKKRRLPQPIYKTLGEEGPDHKKIYERGVYIGDRLVASAKGKNLKLADVGAADAALKILLAEEDAHVKAANPKADTAAKKAEAPKSKAKQAKSESEPNKTKAKGNVPKAEQRKHEAKANVPKAQQTAPRTKPLTKSEQRSKKKATVKSETTPIADAKKQTKVSKSATSAPTKKAALPIAKPSKNATRVEASAAARLKNHATKSKIATPTFKDLGESKADGRTVFRVECIFMGKSAIGTGASRPEAKEQAASQVLSTLTAVKGQKKNKKK